MPLNIIHGGKMGETGDCDLKLQIAHLCFFRFRNPIIKASGGGGMSMMIMYLLCQPNSCQQLSELA